MLMYSYKIKQIKDCIGKFIVHQYGNFTIQMKSESIAMLYNVMPKPLIMFVKKSHLSCEVEPIYLGRL